MAKRRSEYPPDGIFNLHFTPLHIHMRFARSSLVYGIWNPVIFINIYSLKGVLFKIQYHPDFLASVSNIHMEKFSIPYVWRGC